MAIDFEAVRRKLAHLSGKNASSRILWKPAQDVEHTVRLLPFPDNDGQPFKERYFYYGIGTNPGLLAPSQFGKPDPIQELYNKLAEQGQETWDLRKGLRPQLKAYAAVIVRGEEDKGPRIWSFGRKTYTDILKIITDEDFGDITDPTSGHDLKVTMGKATPSAQFATCTVTARPKSTPLSTNPDQVKKWIADIPDISHLNELKSYEELESIINKWLNASSEEKSTASDGDVKSESKSAKKLASLTSSPAASKASSSDDAFNAIDQAFDALMAED